MVHNNIKRFKESLYEKDKAKNQYWMAMIFSSSDRTALKMDTIL